MKLLSAYLSGLLGLLMIAATLLPSLHALDHDPSKTNSDLEISITQTGLNCELCDFHFTSLDTPDFIEYNLYLPLKESLYSGSLTQTVFLFPNSLFSLRAPPVTTA